MTYNIPACKNSVDIEWLIGCMRLHNENPIRFTHPITTLCGSLRPLVTLQDDYAACSHNILVYTI